MSIGDWIMLGLATIGAAVLVALVTGAIAACMLSSEISQAEEKRRARDRDQRPKRWRANS